MKIKKIIYGLLFFISMQNIFQPSFVYASEADSLKKAFENLKQEVKQEDKFRENIKREVNNNIIDWFLKRLFIIGLVLAVAGFFGIKGMDKWLSSHIEEMVKNKVEAEYKNIEMKQLSFQLKFDLNDLRTKWKDLQEKPTFEKVQALIERAKQTKDETFLKNFVDDVIVFIFDVADDISVVKLSKMYEKDSIFKEKTLCNIAISAMNLYDLYYFKEYKDVAITTCRKANELAPYYGEPYSVLLFIEMMDFERAASQKEKQEARENALHIIKRINGGESNHTAYETYDYFERNNKPTIYTAKYFNMMHAEFKDEMEQMKKKHEEYKTKA